MSKRLIELAERRERLIALSSVQRSGFSHNLAPIKTACAVADKGLMALRYLQQHPVYVAAGVGFLVALRPRRAFGLLRKGWFAWRMVQKLRQRLGGI